jgi:pilus assembly protein Flp/PilA
MPYQEWTMHSIITDFRRDESGATAIEYGLIAALVAIGIITVLQLVRTNMRETYTTISDALAAANADQ